MIALNALCRSSVITVALGNNWERRRGNQRYFSRERHRSRADRCQRSLRNVSFLSTVWSESKNVSFPEYKRSAACSRSSPISVLDWPRTAHWCTTTRVDHRARLDRPKRRNDEWLVWSDHPIANNSQSEYHRSSSRSLNDWDEEYSDSRCTAPASVQWHVRRVACDAMVWSWWTLSRLSRELRSILTRDPLIRFRLIYEEKNDIGQWGFVKDWKEPFPEWDVKEDEFEHFLSEIWRTFEQRREHGE